ncbi:beta-L-arabinofuranosidase domain-containing protein [Allorhodopirellula heiligendammensis]|uniref:Non-reducing end beta-L-arabinofuranosidase n=1 Tax=Allorhodopirellula heiligendammensis TaxID=2714739 RepID=A0A5C6C408_9BACT|nr:beta-L-arabinofuranosidase domain-containing protein [Allorhodopirellula heiligendammensis]TWU18767.1 Non-reducing end beta-L-arabinofuranosidase [Allorhodopirellula heiligendammensis]
MPLSYTHLLLLAIACCVAELASAQAVAHRPRPAVATVRLTEVNWADGFGQQRLDTCQVKTAPETKENMRGTQYLEELHIVAGVSEGTNHGAPVNDGESDVGMEAVCALQATKPDSQWDQRLVEIVGIIGRAQRTNGYLHHPVLIANHNGNTTEKRFSDLVNFEMYIMCHLITDACVNHDVSAKASLLTIIRRGADFLDEAYRHRTPQQAGCEICPSHFMSVLDLCRATGEACYLNLAERLIQMGDQIGDDNQDQLPSTRQTEVGWLTYGMPDNPSQPGWGGQFASAWKRPYSQFDRLTTPDDHVEVFSVLALVLLLSDDTTENPEAQLPEAQLPKAQLMSDNVSIHSHFPGDGTVRFCICPKAAKTYPFTIQSNVAALDGKTCGVKSVAPFARVLEDPSLSNPNRWADDAASQFGAGERQSVKSVSRWLTFFSQTSQNACSDPT